MTPVLCENCGSSSFVSGGGGSVCAFCRSPMAAAPREGGNEAVPPVPEALQQAWKEGKIDRCQLLAQSALREQPKLTENADFLVLDAKIGFESEAPVGKLRSQLQKAIALAPQNPEAREYAAIADAKEKIDVSAREVGIQGLKSVLKQSPKNPHALFLLGSTLFWGNQHAAEAMPYLERCTAVRPTFIRAWACLGAVYKTLGRDAFASQAFKKCLELETNPKMIEYFKSLQKR